MIIFFGSAGSGKSTQGALLAEKYGWTQLSTGQIFRDSTDAEIKTIIDRGDLVPDTATNRVVFAALDQHNMGEVILDGYPRNAGQAKTLVEWNMKTYGDHHVDLALMIDVDKDEVMKRMALRGRADDTPEKIEKRLAIYRAEIQPILDYFREQKIPVVHIDGAGSIESIYQRVETALAEHDITGEK